MLLTGQVLQVWCSTVIGKTLTINQKTSNSGEIHKQEYQTRINPEIWKEILPPHEYQTHINPEICREILLPPPQLPSMWGPLFQGSYPLTGLYSKALMAGLQMSKTYGGRNGSFDDWLWNEMTLILSVLQWFSGGWFIIATTAHSSPPLHQHLGTTSFSSPHITSSSAS